MGLAAWPGGMTALMKESGWNDILATCFTESLGRQARPDELNNPPADVMEKAKQFALREKHAARAAELALISWTSPGTRESYHLIQDEDLRGIYGYLIGQLAASHWWTIDQLEERLPSELNAPIEFPDEWTVDTLKLACLLRLADAAHIDARRAPGFLRAIRQPQGISDRHWAFQAHLQRPRLVDDRLVYTAIVPFTEDEALAWWLCYETLQMVDRELHGVDSLLSDRGRPRMAARSVNGADSPLRLKALIPTSGWTPVDARVVVTNVPELVRKLGGASLYGDSPSIALRELIQNASDASRALGVIMNEPPNSIRVRLCEHTDGWRLDVIDCGIGMSQQVLTGPLLDFGRSYWGSQLMRAELSGLAAAQFQATGRFGIGFYSVFMLGSSIKVVTRRYNEASTDTRVLQFASGLDDRPIVRSAKENEILHSGGTIVSVGLAQNPFSPEGLLGTRGPRGGDLRDLCATLAPALPCDLLTQEGNQLEEVCVRANDWKTMSGEELLRRVGVVSQTFPNPVITLSQAADRIRVIERGGEIIARACIAPSPPALRLPDSSSLRPWAYLVTGGLTLTDLGGAIGIFEGVPTKADRTVGQLLITAQELSAWASEQATLWQGDINQHLGGEWDITVALLARLNAAMAELHICCSSQGYMSVSQLREWAGGHNQIYAVNDAWIDILESEDGFAFWHKRTHKQLDLPGNVLLVLSPGQYGEWKHWGDEYPDKRWVPPYSSDRYMPQSTSKYWWYWNQLRLGGLALKIIAEGWQCDLGAVLDSLTGYDTDRAMEVPGSDGPNLVFVEWRAVRPRH
jgi:hypothetical protein